MASHTLMFAVVGVMLLVEPRAMQTLSKTNDDFVGQCSCSAVINANCSNAQLYEVPINKSCESSNLVVLDLSRNIINTLASDSFKDLVMLRDLIISNSHVKLVHKQAFDKMKFLTKLDLSSNEIQYLHSETFQYLENLQDLHLRRNPLKSLQYNIFSGLNRIKTLDLSSCEITTISSNVFNFNKINLVVINTGIPGSSYKSSAWPTEVYIDISDNPLNCNCNLKEFHDFVLSSTDTLRAQYENISCTQPRELKGVRLQAIKSSNYEFCKPGEKLPILINSPLQINSGLNITLSCRINDDPQLELRWTFNPLNMTPRELRPRDDQSGSTKRSLRHSLTWSNKWYNTTIENVRKSDEGTYKCEVYNRSLKLISFKTISLAVLQRSSLAKSGRQTDHVAQWLNVCIVVSIMLLGLVFLLLIIVFTKRKHVDYKMGSSHVNMKDYMIPVPFYVSADDILPKRPLPKLPTSAEVYMRTDGGQDDHCYEEVLYNTPQLDTQSLLQTRKAAITSQQKGGTYDADHYVRPITHDDSISDGTITGHEYTIVLPT